MPDSASKRCRECGQVKPLNEFVRRSDSRDGRARICQECRADQDRSRYEANRDAKQKYQRDYYEANRAAVRDTQRRYRDDNRDVVLNHYGSACTCCGVAEDLTIDHVNGDGQQHRQELYGASQRGTGADHFYVWLIKQGFPANYQTLCRACNSSKRSTAACRLDHVTVP